MSDGGAPEPKWVSMAKRMGLDNVAPVRVDIREPIAASPSPVIEHTRKTADGVQKMVELTELNVEIAKAAQEDAADTKTFSKRMTWASLIISIVGVGIAVASFAVAIAGHH